MYFLASCLTGRARDAIARFTVTADNFDVTESSHCAIWK